MRSIASGVSAAGTLALAQHLLAFGPGVNHQPVDWTSVCGDRHFDPYSFIAGIFTGLLLFGLIEAFLTLRWALIQLVQGCQFSGSREKRPLYKFLNES